MNIQRETEFKNNEFKRFHPLVNFIYFICVIAFSCVFLHPVAISISISAGFCSLRLFKGKKAVKKNLIFMIPSLFIMALVNPVFNHRGATILAYFPGGNPLTLESVCYGFIAAAMIISVIVHFSCFNEVMTSDKFIYLFGRIIPSLSLIFSMTLRFIPRFINQFKLAAESQKCLGRDISNGTVIKRAKSGLSILSIMITWSLENAIETSASMKSRGYGLPGRTAFSTYRFTKRDGHIIACILLLSSYIILGSILGQMEFICFPTIAISSFSFYGLTVFTSYFLLMLLPVFIELWEVRRWKYTK